REGCWVRAKREECRICAKRDEHWARAKRDEYWISGTLFFPQDVCLVDNDNGGLNLGRLTSIASAVMVKRYSGMVRR
ncbi:hypothetical protein, partial [Cardiobacterium valvarum]